MLVSINKSLVNVLVLVSEAHQGESLRRGQTVDGYFLQACDDAAACHGFTLGHPQHSLISQHQVAGHVDHHLTQLGK